MGKKSISKMKDVVYHTFRKEYPEKVGTSLTLKEALGKPNENNRKNLTRLYAGLSSSSNNPLGMSTPQVVVKGIYNIYQ